MGQLRLVVLGTPVICHGGQVIRFPTRKVLALLPYLAVERGHHGRDQLVSLLWPDSRKLQAGQPSAAA